MNINYNPFVILSAAKNKYSDHKLGQCYIDVTHYWKSHDIKVLTVAEIDNFLNTYKNIGYKSIKTNNIADIILSEERIKVITLCQRQIDFIKDDTEQNSSIIKRVIVQGKARSGKSTMINKTMGLMINKFGTKAIVITAPTEVAAINIGENALHSRLSIPVKSAKFTELKNDSLRKYQKKNQHFKFIITRRKMWLNYHWSAVAGLLLHARAVIIRTTRR